MAKLMRYDTAEMIREATEEEHRASIEASRVDGGAGVITVDGVRCYVETGAGDVARLDAWLDEEADGEVLYAAIFARYDTALRLRVAP